MKKKFIKKMSKGLGVIGGLATVVAPIVACGGATGTTDNKGTIDNKKDKLDVNTIFDSISGNAKTVDKSSIDAVPEGTAFDNDLADDLGITLPADLLGTTVTYSHNVVNTDGSLTVKIKITKGEATKDKSLIIEIKGIDVNNVKDGISGGDKHVDSISIPAATGADLTSSGVADSLGITLPQNIKGTLITYSNVERTSDGPVEFMIKIKKNGTEATKKVTVTFTGIDDAKSKLSDTTAVDNVFNGISGNKKVVNAKLINAVPEGTTLSDSLAADIGITLPPDLLDTTITYSHDAIDKDGSLTVKIKITKGEATKDKSLIIAITGIDINAVADGIDGNSLTTNKIQIDSVAPGTALDKTKATALGLTFPDDIRGTTITYSHSMIKKDGDLTVNIQIIKNSIPKDKTLTIHVTGINDARANMSDADSVQQVFNNISAPSEKVVNNKTLIEAAVDKAYDKDALAVLGVVIPEDLGTTITYSHKVINSDTSVVVTIKITKGIEEQTKTLDPIAIKGIDANKAAITVTTKDVTIHQTSVPQTSGGWVGLDSATATKLGIITPSTPVATYKYKIPADIVSDGNHVIKIQATSNGVSHENDITLHITGITVTKAVNDVLGDIQGPAGKINIDDQYVRAATNDPLTPTQASVFGITLPNDIQGTTITYEVGAYTIDMNITVYVKVTKDGITASKRIRIDVVGIEAHNAIKKIKTKQVTIPKPQIDAVTTWTTLDAATATKLGITLPTVDHTPTYEYKIPNNITSSGEYDINIKATTPNGGISVGTAKINVVLTT